MGGVYAQHLQRLCIDKKETGSKAVSARKNSTPYTKGAVACTGLAAENPSISKYTDRASYMFLNERGMFSSLRIQCVFRCVNRKREID